MDRVAVMEEALGFINLFGDKQRKCTTWTFQFDLGFRNVETRLLGREPSKLHAREACWW